MSEAIRVALFPDSFAELNGVGTVSREFVSFAQSRQLPFCCVYGGRRTEVKQEGSAILIQLKRSLCSFPVDKGLYCDPLLNRYLHFVVDQVAAFQPDVIQITSPGDLGILGFWVSHRLRVPLAASWHTNLHEYLGRRIHKTLSFAPGSLRARSSAFAERKSMEALVKYYRLAHFVLAPNHAMADLLGENTERPSYQMRHGVDSNRFTPVRRERKDGKFCIGWVGRLTPEKNVRVFAELEAQLLSRGETNFRMLIVGEGSERGWLETHLKTATFTGALDGGALADAFASMDAFVFPSQTDTFGLVILEALASGVPVLLGREASERVGIEDGIQGFAGEDFCSGIQKLMHCEGLRESMGVAAQALAQSQSWKSAFDDLYRTYSQALVNDRVLSRLPRERQEALLATCRE